MGPVYVAFNMTLYFLIPIYLRLGAFLNGHRLLTIALNVVGVALLPEALSPLAEGLVPLEAGGRFTAA